MRIVPFVVLALAAPLFGGGFYLEVSSVGKPADAVMIARLTGCHNPEEGQVEATAEGLVNGKRQTLPLSITALAEPGTYAVKQQWPAEGKWVVWLKAKHPSFGQATESVIAVAGNTFTRQGAIFTGGEHHVLPSQIDAMLQGK